jgi:hypothetical protein
MKIRQFAIVLSMASALTLAISGLAMAAGPVYYSNDQIPTGNAASECASIGTFAYAHKWNEGGGEGAPNGAETATFYNADGSVDHTNNITISNSMLDDDGESVMFDWSSSPNGIGAVLVKAGTGYNVYTYNPQVMGDTGLYGPENKGISHVTFCWNKDVTEEVGEWCSPGYWKNHPDAWAATGISPTALYSDYFGAPTRSPKGRSDGAPTNPTLSEVVENPQWYGGDAANNVGDLLSEAHPDVDFESGDERVENCPLN